MPDDTHVLATAERRITYSSLPALYLDMQDQLADGEAFSILDAEGATIVDGIWHPMTPSRFT